MQEKENVAHLQFDLAITEVVEVPAFIVPVVEEEPAEEPAEVVEEEPEPPAPEPEPEPEPEEKEEPVEEEEEEVEEEVVDGTGAKSIEFKPDWQRLKKKTAKDVSRFRDAARAFVPPPLPVEKPAPLALRACEATRDGRFKTCFNQRCIVPPFEELGGQPGKRGLLKMSEIDVTRDVVDLRFSLQSDVNVSDIKYTLDITDWTEHFFEIYINYTNPLLIS